MKLPCLIAAVAALSLSPAAAEIRQFRDWIAACDNLRSCTAFGVGVPDGGVGYLILRRGGAPAATATFTFAIDVPTGGNFTLAFDDASLPGLPHGPFTWPRADADFGRVAVSAPSEVETFVASLRKAKRLTVTRIDPPGGKSDPPAADISLDGAVAAMLWIDEQQRRLDTVTALIRRGPKPAGAVPAPPHAPRVAGVAGNPAPPPKAPPPAVVAKAKGSCGDDDERVEFSEATRLDRDLVMYWFTCRDISGAYNLATALLIAPESNPAAVRAPRFVAPPGLENFREKDAIAVNASYDSKTTTLTTFDKGRGIGDCGATTEWAWDGRAFQLTDYRSMPHCRGVFVDDWPALYRAERQ